MECCASISIDAFRHEGWTFLVSGPAISTETRLELIRRARDKKLRSFEFTAEEPVVWKPTEVLNPSCDLPFTDISAWHFIADQLEAGCAVQVVTLQKPPNELGYEMRFLGASRQPQIYVKVRLHGRRIIGRSFHNSTREDNLNA
jgi:hypothetical protein